MRTSVAAVSNLSMADIEQASYGVNITDAQASTWWTQEEQSKKEKEK